MNKVSSAMEHVQASQDSVESFFNASSDMKRLNAAAIKVHLTCNTLNIYLKLMLLYHGAGWRPSNRDALNPSWREGS